MYMFTYVNICRRSHIIRRAKGQLIEICESKQICTVRTYKNEKCECSFGWVGGCVFFSSSHIYVLRFLYSLLFSFYVEFTYMSVN